MVVPHAWSLLMIKRPPTAATLSVSPRRQDPKERSAPPTPSSETSTTANPEWRPSETHIRRPFEYFTALVIASETTKYKAVSSGGASRAAPSSPVTSTGIGHRSVRDLMAGTHPAWVRIIGGMRT